MELPTFQEIRQTAYVMSGDLQDEMRSDWRAGTGPTPAQAATFRRAQTLMNQVKDALNEAAG